MLAKKFSDIITYPKIPIILLADLRLPVFSQNCKHPYDEKTEC